MGVSLQVYCSRIGTFQSKLVKQSTSKLPTAEPTRVQTMTVITMLVLLTTIFLGCPDLSLSPTCTDLHCSTQTSSTAHFNLVVRDHGCADLVPMVDPGCTDHVLVVDPDQALPSLYVWDPGLIHRPHLLDTNQTDIDHELNYRYQATVKVELLQALHRKQKSAVSWMSVVQVNRLAHITFGNRGKRGKGISCLYWNKGPAFLTNK
jgi:hypothetical protein